MLVQDFVQQGRFRVLPVAGKKDVGAGKVVLNEATASGFQITDHQPDVLFSDASGQKRLQCFEPAKNPEKHRLADGFQVLLHIQQHVYKMRLLR